MAADAYRFGWAALIAGMAMITGCSAPALNAPVLRTPLFVDSPAYDSSQCEDARRLDAQAVTWWLPSSCFKPVSR